MFSLWTVCQVGYNNLMVVDLQGVVRADCLVLTDPVVLCKDTTLFSASNLGADGIKMCRIAAKLFLAAHNMPGMSGADVQAGKLLIPTIQQRANMHKDELDSKHGDDLYDYAGFMDGKALYFAMLALQ
jgi:hypothetical protein